MKFEWKILDETINNNHRTVTSVAKVFGGWLVLNENFGECGNITCSESMVFVPDPNHEWM